MAPERDDETPAGREWEDDTADLTLPEEEWPVPAEYRASEPSPSAHTVGERAPQGEPVPPAVPPSAGPSRRGFLLGAVLGLLLLAAVVGAAIAFGLPDGDGQAGRDELPAATPPTTGPAETTEPRETTGETTPPPVRVTVPDLSGMSVADARRRLSALDLEARVREQASERPEGEVVRQQPEAEEEVRRETTVSLVVSSGPQQLAVPEVVGLPRARAEVTLREAGLRVSVRTTASPQAPGTVLQQAPAADASVERSTVVRLVVAVRPEPALADVPSLVGLTVDRARARLGQRGLRSRVSQVESNRPEGTVLRQSPRAGASVREGSVVQLEVSSGPALADVPDVLGLDEAGARGSLEAAGFRVQVTEEATDDPDGDGVVVRQSPEGGSQAREGTTVTITIGLFG